MIYHCFFEQSGTFKNQFKKLGFKSFDYDICNDFGETDFVLDLFLEIEKAFDRLTGKGKRDSILLHFGPDDYCLAFFPCIRFSQMFLFSICCYGKQYKNMPLQNKLLHSLEAEKERSYFYQVFCHLVYVALVRGFPLVIENPYDKAHYLTRYFPCLPSFIDFNRRSRGDYFEKPTQYFFFNCQPSNNLLFECVEMQPFKFVNQCHGFERSQISSEYANRFIREFILSPSRTKEDEEIDS